MAQRYPTGLSVKHRQVFLQRGKLEDGSMRKKRVFSMRRQRLVLHPAGTFPLWSCWTRILNRETYLEDTMQVVVGNSALSTFPRYGIGICSCDLLAVAFIFVRLKAGNEFAWLYLFFCFCNLRGNLIRWNFHRLRRARSTSSSSLFLRMYLGAWDNKKAIGGHVSVAMFVLALIHLNFSCQQYLLVSSAPSVMPLSRFQKY